MPLAAGRGACSLAIGKINSAKSAASKHTMSSRNTTNASERGTRAICRSGEEKGPAASGLHGSSHRAAAPLRAGSFESLGLLRRTLVVSSTPVRAPNMTGTTKIIMQRGDSLQHLTLDSRCASLGLRFAPTHAEQARHVGYQFCVRRQLIFLDVRHSKRSTPFDDLRSRAAGRSGHAGPRSAQRSDGSA